MRNNVEPKTGFRKVLAISLSDIKRVLNSIVAVVIIFGLCVVPCLYGWFNIFSNWDPYGAEATGRIKIAVVSVDKGADIFGVELNVGDKVISGLEANKTIGWVFVDTLEEAYNLALSGDCYAAIVIPESFSKDVLSFVDLGFQHPTINYYENQKMNAIAPKITGKAKTAVQQTVNTTFLETMSEVIANVLNVFDAAGIDYDSTVENLGDKIDALQDDLDQVDGLLGSICNLCSSAADLMYYSAVLSGNVAETAYNSQNMSSQLSKDTQSLNTNVTQISETTTQELRNADGYLTELYDKTKAGEITAEEAQELANAKLKEISNLKDTAFSAVASGEHTDANYIAYSILVARSEIIYALYSDLTDMSASVSSALNSASATADNAASAFGQVGDKATGIQNTLNGTVGSLQKVESDLYRTRSDILKAKTELMDIQDMLDELAGSDFLRELTDTAMDNTDSISTYFSSPIKMGTVVEYPIDNYGSAMAPFYTVLAQYVGALFCATLLKAKIRKEDFPYNLTVPESYFGRYIFFIIICLIQAIVVSVGDLVFVGIYCLHPVKFVLTAIVTGICFGTLNYSLSYALEKIGLGASVIIMVIQVAGSGGSYPVQVLPKIFQIIYPIMPFNYAMNGMREAIAGTYGNNFIKDIMILVLMTAIFIVFGLLVKKPASFLNKLIDESAEKAEIML